MKLKLIGCISCGLPLTELRTLAQKEETVAYVEINTLKNNLKKHKINNH